MAHGLLGCLVSIDDLADRQPRRLADGEVIELGGRRVRHLDTPHAPHNCEARVLYEDTTGVLLCGDLMTQMGNGPALTASDLVEQADVAEDVFHATSLAPPCPPPSTGWRSWRPPRWRSCTVRASPGTGYGTARSRTGLPGPAGRLINSASASAVASGGMADVLRGRADDGRFGSDEGPQKRFLLPASPYRRTIQTARQNPGQRTTDDIHRDAQHRIPRRHVGGLEVP
ncbi:hypothetical protein [Nocardia abscessus]|uniref:hypothetical protein n=1 Tax=Nocardia abscessus TaxID=120957 RepID=UPI0024566CBE|nr:hypothetical protein [Nocardia abscessus]